MLFRKQFFENFVAVFKGLGNLPLWLRAVLWLEGKVINGTITFRNILRPVIVIIINKTKTNK